MSAQRTLRDNRLLQRLWPCVSRLPVALSLFSRIKIQLAPRIAWVLVLGSTEPDENPQKVNAACCGCGSICLFLGREFIRFLSFPQERGGEDEARLHRPRIAVSVQSHAWSHTSAHALFQAA